MKYDNVVKYLIRNYVICKEYTFEEIIKLFNIDKMSDFDNELKKYINPNYILEVNFIKRKIYITKHIKLSIDNKIIDIRGSIWECIITFENGYILKCNDELENGKFTIFTKSLKISDNEKNILKKLIKERNDKLNNYFINIK